MEEEKVKEQGLFKVVDGIICGSKTINFTVELTSNDIFNWLNNCKDVKTLKYLGNAALNFAKSIQNPRDDNDVYS